MGSLIGLVMGLLETTLDVYGVLCETVEHWKKWRRRRAEKRKKQRPPA